MKRLSPLLLVVLLAACGDDAPAVDDGRAASGEVLEGTISDAMLPVDRVRSQPPLAEPEARATGSSPVQAGGADSEVEEPGAEPEDEPAVEAAD